MLLGDPRQADQRTQSFHFPIVIHQSLDPAARSSAQAPSSLSLGHDVFYLCFSSSARIDFILWQEKKNFKENASLRPDKFAWTSTVLNSRREIDRLLDANNSIMETDGEGKFVSFKAGVSR